MSETKELLQNHYSKNDGDGFITLNGNIEQGFKIDKLEINVEMITEEKRFLNQRTEQSAVRGLKIGGSVAFYAVTSALAQAIEGYKNGGEYPEITLQGYAKINNGEKQEVLVTGVILKKLMLLGLEGGSAETTIYESDITANDYQIIQ